MSPLASSLAVRRSVFALLLIALVLVQTLGLMHRIVHAHGRSSPVEVPAVSVDGGSAESWVKALFEGHDSERDCAQYDQLSHGDLAWGSAVAITSAAAEQAVVVHHPGWHLAAQAAGFLARGPPALG
jgi:hypothetical protein